MLIHLVWMALSILMLENIMRKVCLILLSLLLSISISSANEFNEVHLKFGVYQSDKASEMHRKFNPLITYLSTEVSRTLDTSTAVSLKIYRSYKGANDALVAGDIDFVRFGPASYILAQQKQENIQLLAMEEKKGKTKFNGLIVVLKDSPIKKLSDLAGHSFAFGNENSTIGRYLAQSELLKAGIDSSSIIKSEFLGRHDKVFKAVELGDYDAGSLKESTFKKMNINNQLRVLHSFENITKPWIAREGLEPKVFDALSQALINLSDTKILKLYKVSSFVPTNSENYQYVRDSMQRSKLF